MPEELAQTIEAEIRAQAPPLTVDCAWLDEVIWPHHGGLSIANVPASIARALGAALPGAAPPLDARLWPPEARPRRVLAILLDGFGYDLLAELRAEAEIASAVEAVVGDGVLAPLTSIFPSTTASALTTLWTGYPAAGHGMLGTRLLLREYGVLANTLSLAPVGGGDGGELMRWGLDPSALIQVPGIAGVLAEAGAPVHQVVLGHLAGSGLSHVLHRGVAPENMHTVRTFEDMWLVLGEVMEATRGRRCFISAYWGGLDAVSHSAGARSARALAEARVQLRRLRDFVARHETGDGETALFVLADHGHLDIRENIYVADHPDLAETFRMPFAAEGRARFLFVRDGRRAQAEEYLRRELGDRVMVLDASAALAAGLFGEGPVHPETPARIGDLLAVCREGTALYDSLDRYVYTSQHGALAAGEMLVPLITRML